MEKDESFVKIVNQQTRLGKINQENYQPAPQTYSNKYFGQNANSKDFLAAVTEKIPVDELFKIVDIGNFDQNQAFCPILKEIVNQDLQHSFMGKYLLQVWSAGIMVYQRILKHPVRLWGMFRHNDTFVFLLDNRDECDQDKDVFHLVFLGGSRRKTGDRLIDEIKIPDWTGLADSCDNLLLGVTSDDTLFVANYCTIHSFNFGVLYQSSNEHLCQVSDLESHTFYESTIKESRCLKLLQSQQAIFEQAVFHVPGPVKLLRLTESISDSILIGMFETKENLLDFCQITKQEEHISIQQLVQSTKRRCIIDPDPITKVRLVQLYGDGMFKGPIVALRQSGQIDFYWNLSLVYSTDASSEDYSYSEIKVNYQKIIVIQVSNKDSKKQQLEIDMTFEEQISTKEAVCKEIAPDFDTTATRSTALGHDTPENGDEQGCSRFSTRLLEEYYKPFQSLVLSGNNFFLAFGNFVSVYDNLEGKWVAHIKFKGQNDRMGLLGLETMFLEAMAYNKQKKVIKVFRQEDSESQMGVLFQDGSIELIVRKEALLEVERKWVPKPCQAKVLGEIVKVCEDQEHHRIIYILSKHEGRMHLWSFTGDKLFDITTFVDGVCSETELIPLFSPAHNSQIILMNKSEGVLRIYEHSIPDGPVTLSLTKIKTLRSEFLKTVEIKPYIHTAFSTDLDKNLFLLDNFNMYHFCLASVQVRDGANWIMQGRTFRNMYIVRVQLFQNQLLYVLHNSSFEIREGSSKSYFDRKVKKTNGFGVIDLKMYLQGLNKTRPFILSIMSSVVGVNSELAFSECNQKIVFLNSYEQVKVVPLLHQNVLDFEGMLPKANYLAMSRISDKFIALDRQNYLTTWCVQTGARMAKNKVLGFDFQDYQVWGRHNNQDDFEKDVYSKGLFSYSLLYKQTPLEITCDDFFGQKRMQHFGGENSSYLKCQDAFHRFDLVEIKSPTQILVHFNFDFPSEPDQHLFFNQDLSLMLKIQGSTLTFYSVLDDCAEGLLKKKMKIRMLNPRMPVGLVDRRPYQILSLFSPDFSQYIDYCNQSSQYVVRQTFETKSDQIILQDQIVFRIPKELLKQQALLMKHIKTQLKFIAWHDQDSIKIIDISNSDNICKVISISLTNKNQGVIVELNSSYVPFFDKEQSQGNFFKDETSLSRDDTELRFMRKHQVFRSLSQNESGINKTGLKIIRSLLEQNGSTDRRSQLFNHLIKVDYYSCTNKVCIDLPFNYFTWAMMDEFSTLSMAHGKVLKENLKKVDVELARIMLLSILPTCDTMLHKCVKHFEVIKFVHKITTKEDDFYVPFIKNLQGKTPLHLCVDKQSEEMRLAEYFLGEMLPKMPLDHHGKAIADIIPCCISRGLSQIKYYMDQRILTTDACSKVFRVPGQSQKINFEEDKFVSCTSLWPDKREFYSNVFETSPVERESEIKILDLPFLHDASRQESIDFFQALADQKGLELLESEAVRTVIAYRWPETKSETLKQLFLPYCGYMAVFIFWVFVLYSPSQMQLNFDTVPIPLMIARILCQLVLIGFSFYFLYFEFRQIRSLSFLQYFSSIWNYVDILPPILILAVLIMGLVNDEIALQTSLQAISNFFMWFKLFYFFRIFEQTGYFINMLMKVLENTQVFFFLLCIMMLAFASTNFILTAKTDPTVFGSVFAAYMSGIGEMNTDFSEESDNPRVIGVFFFLSTLAINIVMLNLLIAIVGIAFEDTMSQKVAANASERASMICENRNLIKQKDAQQEYLLIAQEVRTEAKE